MTVMPVGFRALRRLRRQIARYLNTHCNESKAMPIIEVKDNQAMVIQDCTIWRRLLIAGGEGNVVHNCVIYGTHGDSIQTVRRLSA